MTHMRGCCCGACSPLGPHLVAGGLFTEAGGQAAQYVAAWGADAQGVFRWAPLQGLNGPVHALAVADGRLYVGGDFTASVAAGSIPAVVLDHVAYWDCDRWRPLPGGGVNGAVRAIKRIELGGLSPETIVIAGDFQYRRDGLPLPRAAVLSSLGLTAEIIAAPNNVVRAIGVRDLGPAGMANPGPTTFGVLGGQFTSPSANVCEFTGGLDPAGANGWVYAALHRVEGATWNERQEYALLGGAFNAAANGSKQNLALVWRPGAVSAWSLLGTQGLKGGIVSSLLWSPTLGTVLVGGTFQRREDDLAVLRAAKLSPAGILGDPVQIGAGFNGDVRAFADFMGAVYAAGSFTGSGAAPIDRVAILSGGAWSALPGGGVSGGPVNALVGHDFGAGQRRAATTGERRPCGCGQKGGSA